jgi:hypothetical protein
MTLKSVELLNHLVIYNRIANFNKIYFGKIHRLCGLVVRVPGYRSRGPGSILGTTIFSEK